MMLRKVLAALLTALLAIPAAASADSGTSAVATPIGTFSYSDSAIIGGAGALAGTTVFSGDMIEVGPRGSAWILLNGGMQVGVSSASRLRLKEQASGKNQIEMEMFSGTARFRTSEATPVVARLADATVRAKGANPAVGIISLLSRNKAIIGAEKGDLLVSTAHDGKSVRLREGESVEVLLVDPSAPGNPQDKNNKTTGAKTLSGGQVAIIGVVLAAVVIAIGIKLAKDNKGLTDLEKQNLVSPFKFP
jgi:hypothetical protein